MKIISVANQKGGCGKTTTAINLAGALSDAGKKILLIDLDPQSHASFGLGATGQILEKSIYNVLTDKQDKRTFVTECISNIAPNLDIIPSNILLSTLEQELKDKDDAVSRLYQVFSTGCLDYDFAIIDCPPSLGFLTFNALRASDLVIVPLDMSAFSLMGVGKLLGMLELIKIKIGHAPKVNALATIFDRRTKYSQVILDEIRGFFKEEMFQTVIRMNVTLKKAAYKGVSVLQFDRKSNGALDYMALAQELLRAVGAYDLEKAIMEAEMAISQAATALNKPNPFQKAPAEPMKNRMPEPAINTLPRLKIEDAFREIAFTIEAPKAKDIYLVGDFNHWKINDDSRLAKLEGGRWEKKVGLAPGRYKYKFVVDGEWILDTSNIDREQNAFGTFDSIVKL